MCAILNINRYFHSLRTVCSVLDISIISSSLFTFLLSKKVHVFNVIKISIDLVLQTWMWAGYKAVDSWFQGLHLLFLDAVCWTMNRTSSARRVFLSRSFSLLFVLTEASVSLFPAMLMWKQVGHCTNFLLFNNDSDYQEYLFCWISFSRWVCSCTLQSCRWLWLLWSPCGCVVISDFSPSSSFSHQNPFKSHDVSLVCAHTRFSAC